MSILIRNVETNGRIQDVRIDRGRVVAVGPVARGAAAPAAATEVVDGRGGALIPGLHDRHLHLLALAARERSVDLGHDRAPGPDLGTRLHSAPGSWIRATGYHESIAGPLDRWALDRLTGNRPTRVQHRGGALWILNSAALRQIRLDHTTDVERDDRGRPNGRLWRYDARLREQLDDPPPDLLPWGQHLAELGITAVTDATAELDAQAAALISVLPQRVTLLGAGEAPDGLRLGPRKILLRDHDLPTYAALKDLILSARSENRCVAVHCVTRIALVLTLAVLEEVGRRDGDRIEHAAVVPDPHLLKGLTVVTQPAFVTDRGDDYLREVDPDDLPHLYRHASLIEAGLLVHASSDAPFGPLDPWEVIRAARDRRTASGRTLGPGERVPAELTLTSYFSFPAIRPGSPADLCLLRSPLGEVLRRPERGQVRAVWIGGQILSA